MKKKLRLLKSWDHGGTTYAAGTVLELEADETFIKGIVSGGFAEVIDEPKSVKAVEPAPAPEPDKKAVASDPPVTAADVDRMIKDAKMASAAPSRPHIAVVKDEGEGDPKFGYKHFGEWLTAVKNAATDPDARKDIILRGCKALGTDEYATVEDSIGGFLIPPEFRSELLRKGLEDEFVMNPAKGNALVLNINSTMLRIPVEVDTDRQTTLFGGVQVYRTAERSQMTAARGKFEMIELKPEDMTGLVFVTDNMLRNAANIADIIGRQFRDAFMYKQTNEFLYGTGVGESLGVASASNGARIAVTRALASNISTDDVLNMRAKCFDYDGAIWLAGIDTFPAIMKLAVTVGVAGSAVMLFNAAVQERPATLLGRPILFTEFASALGAANDIMLMSFRHYVIAFTSRVVNDSSIHVRYDSNETAFRFVQQLQGMPWWRTTLTTKKAVVVSPFITLAA